MKLHSHKVIHKAEVGGVALNLQDAQEVKKTFSSMQKSVGSALGKEAFLGVTVQKMISMQGVELIIGSLRDPQFGPVILFGTGGRYVEAIGDKTLGLPPLGPTSAKRMIERTKASSSLLLELGKGKMGQIEELLIAFSRMIIELPAIKECDINPVLVSSEEVVCLDARIILMLPE